MTQASSESEIAVFQRKWAFGTNALIRNSSQNITTILRKSL